VRRGFSSPTKVTGWREYLRGSAESPRLRQMTSLAWRVVLAVASDNKRHRCGVVGGHDESREPARRAIRLEDRSEKSSTAARDGGCSGG